jgi:exonuclease III
LFNWNVRGLNNVARRQVVIDLVIENKSTIACLQETKLDYIDEGSQGNFGA